MKKISQLKPAKGYTLTRFILHFESEFQEQNVAIVYDHHYKINHKSEYCQEWSKYWG